MDITRRDALIAGLAAAASASGAGPDGATQAGPHGGRPQLALDGELRRDRATRALAADDFGHLVRRPPAGVLLPASERGRRRRRSAGPTSTAARSRPRAGGHSVFGRGQTGPDGVVIDVRLLRTVHARSSATGWWSTPGRPGARCSPRRCRGGWRRPGSADYLRPVGRRHADRRRRRQRHLAVRRAERQRAATCRWSRARRAARLLAGQRRGLFDAVRAGLGQVAVVTRATLRLGPGAPAGPPVPAGLPGPGDDAGRRAPPGPRAPVRAGAGGGAARPGGGWTFRLDLVKEPPADPPDDDALLAGLSDDRPRAESSTLPYLEYLDRLAALERLLRSEGQMVVPASVADHLRRRPGGRVGGRRGAGQAGAGRPGTAGPGGGLPDPPGVGQDPAAAAAAGPAGLHVQPGAVPTDRRRRRGAAAGDGQPGRLRAGPGRRRHPVPGQRLPHVGRRLAPPFRGRLRPAPRRQAQHDPGHVLTPGYEVSDVGAPPGGRLDVIRGRRARRTARRRSAAARSARRTPARRARRACSRPPSRRSP